MVERNKKQDFFASPVISMHISRCMRVVGERSLTSMGEIEILKEPNQETGPS